MTRSARRVDFEKFGRILAKERKSARAVAILTAAHIDTVLEKALTRVLVDSPVVRELFDGQRALATSAARIDLAFGLGLISDQTRCDLHRIRKVRNHFAHEVAEGNFDTEPVRSHMRQMSGYRFATAIMSASRNPNDTLRAYDVMCVITLGVLEAKVGRARRGRPKVPQGIDLPAPTGEELEQLRSRRHVEETAAKLNEPVPSPAQPPRRRSR